MERIFLLCLGLSQLFNKGSAIGITNPSAVVLDDPLADPGVLLVDGTYHVFATENLHSDVSSSIKRNVPLASSESFSSGWRAGTANVLPKTGAWTYKEGGDAHVWAPGIGHYHEPEEFFAMYYSANVDASTHCIGVASSNEVLGEYVPQSSPLICPGRTSGQGSIDADPISVDGQHYLIYKYHAASSASINLQRLLVEPNNIRVDTSFDPVELVHATPAEFDTEGGVLIQNPLNGHFILLFVTGFYKDASYTIEYATSDTLVPAAGEHYKKRGVLLCTGKTNGVELFAPGAPDFATPHQMTFMTYEANHSGGKRVLRTANVTYTDDDVVRILPNSGRFSQTCTGPVDKGQGP